MTTAADTEVARGTEPIRLSSSVLGDVRAIAPVLGTTPRGYIESVVRTALEHDLPRAAEELTRRGRARSE